MFFFNFFLERCSVSQELWHLELLPLADEDTLHAWWAHHLRFHRPHVDGGVLLALCETNIEQERG